MIERIVMAIPPLTFEELVGLPARDKGSTTPATTPGQIAVMLEVRADGWSKRFSLGPDS
jgi:hypothetical protein